MTTVVEPATDTVDQLDFTPICEVEERVTELVNGRHTRVVVKCSNHAAWIGETPCGHDFYFCDTHHYDQRAFTCLVCGRRDLLFATYRWVRL